MTLEVLAGGDQELVSQDLRREGEDPRHHAGPQTAWGCCVCACMLDCVRVATAGGCQRRLAWHRSQFQRLPWKWGGNDSANSVLKTDRESDFGELTTALTKDTLCSSYKINLYLYISGVFHVLDEFPEMTQACKERICNYFWSMTFISFQHLACIMHPGDKAN